MAMLNYQRVLRKAMDLSNDTWRLHVQDTAPSADPPTEAGASQGTPGVCSPPFFRGTPYFLKEEPLGDV